MKKISLRQAVKFAKIPKKYKKTKYDFNLAKGTDTPLTIRIGTKGGSFIRNSRLKKTCKAKAYRSWYNGLPKGMKEFYRKPR